MHFDRNLRAAVPQVPIGPPIPTIGYSIARAWQISNTDVVASDIAADLCSQERQSVTEQAKSRRIFLKNEQQPRMTLNADY